MGMPDNGNQGNMMREPPAKPEGEQGNTMGNPPPEMNQNSGGNINSSELNSEFKVSGISNQYSGIATYSESETSASNIQNNKTLTIIIVVLSGLVVALLIALIVAIKKNRK